MKFKCYYRERLLTWTVLSCDDRDMLIVFVPVFAMFIFDVNNDSKTRNQPKLQKEIKS